MGLSNWIIKLRGWKIVQKCEIPDKCVFVVAPHTSLHDFIWGRLAFWSLNIKVAFMIKSEFFIFPLGYLLKSMGAIPIKRGNRNNDMVSQVAKVYASRKYFRLVITPEATRKKTKRWKKGFWMIAHEAKVPIVYGTVDYKTKTMTVVGEFPLTNDWEADHAAIKKCYVGIYGKYPDCFTTE